MNRVRKYLEERKLFHYGLIRPEVVRHGMEWIAPYIGEGSYSEFAESDLSKRTNPESVLPGTKSILVVLFPYEMKNERNIDDSYGVASFAVGEDYHEKNGRILKGLAETLGLGKSSDGLIGIHVDNGPMNDRFLAYGAGLGWYGKNCLLINPSLGSAFTIGSLFMKTAFKEGDYAQRTLFDRCGDCRRCLDACPSGAIKAGRKIDCRLCLSERLQSKRKIPYDLLEKMCGSVYGCDICQLACPYNDVMPYASEKGNSLIEDLKMGKREFSERYGKKAFSWRGFSVYKRNLLILLGNRFRNARDPDAFMAALACADSPSDMVAQYALWALSSIDRQRARLWMEERMEKEMDCGRLTRMKELKAYYLDEKEGCL